MRLRSSLTCFWGRSLSGDRLKVGEFKKSTAEVKAGVVSIVAILNKHDVLEPLKRSSNDQN
ncbi:MAG: hypothetical protein A2705_03570 [Omnitrophica WOR_2 bacterium RIFCSPHIGHO2_01_FULL_52_10]|nr:MAG: hypothetical protein A2705_03570 [Omnitrophica WOR_2 bacterium RIFCSPHIGHO2_01_FULL_52_10]